MLNIIKQSVFLSKILDYNIFHSFENISHHNIITSQIDRFDYCELRKFKTHNRLKIKKCF